MAMSCDHNRMLGMNGAGRLSRKRRAQKSDFILAY